MNTFEIGSEFSEETQHGKKKAKRPKKASIHSAKINKSVGVSIITFSVLLLMVKSKKCNKMSLVVGDLIETKLSCISGGFVSKFKLIQLIVVRSLPNSAKSIS